MVVCVGEAVAVGRLLAARALSLATGRDVRKGEGAMGTEAEPPLFFSNGCFDESSPSALQSFGSGTSVSAAAFPTASAAQHAAHLRCLSAAVLSSPSALFYLPAARQQQNQQRECMNTPTTNHYAQYVASSMARHSNSTRNSHLHQHPRSVLDDNNSNSGSRFATLYPINPLASGLCLLYCNEDLSAHYYCEAIGVVGPTAAVQRTHTTAANKNDDSSVREGMKRHSEMMAADGGVGGADSASLSPLHTAGLGVLLSSCSSSNILVQPSTAANAVAVNNNNRHSSSMRNGAAPSHPFVTVPVAARTVTTRPRVVYRLAGGKRAINSLLAAVAGGYDTAMIGQQQHHRDQNRDGVKDGKNTCKGT